MLEPPRRPEQAAHDVLAAEAFAMPAADPDLHHRPVVLPEDPTGIAEPHDVLAAEEFPMPAPVRRSGIGIAGHARGRGKAVAAVGALALVGLRVLRRR